MRLKTIMEKVTKTIAPNLKTRSAISGVADWRTQG
jgi:hypothetical protein